MATILEFRPAGRTQSMPVLKSTRTAATGEVVFFPGVRYERWSDEAAAKPRRLKKRDKIEVND